MKNSSTLRETSFLLNDGVQRGQCWSLRGRAPMETCPECCWKTGASWVPATHPYTENFPQAKFQTPKPQTWQFILLLCLPFQEQAGNMGKCVAGNLGSWGPGKVHAASASWDKLWGNTSPSHLSCFQCMKKLKHIHIALYTGNTHWEKSFKCDEKQRIWRCADQRRQLLSVWLLMAAEQAGFCESCMQYMHCVLTWHNQVLH